MPFILSWNRATDFLSEPSRSHSTEHYRLSKYKKSILRSPQRSCAWPPTVPVLKSYNGANRAMRPLGFCPYQQPPRRLHTKCSPPWNTLMLPSSCFFFIFRQMASKLTRWLLATNTDIYFIWGEEKKKSKLFFSKKKKKGDAMPRLFWFIFQVVPIAR